jgi:hypothetical protein
VHVASCRPRALRLGETGRAERRCGNEAHQRTREESEACYPLN